MMRIFIITMDDPIQTNSFIQNIIENRRDDIVGLAVTKANRLTLQKNRSKFKYLLSLLLIMGVINFLKNSLITALHKIKKKANSILPSLIEDPSILGIAKKYKIKTWNLETPNNESFLDELVKLKVDLIINQSQNILKNRLLSIPRIGVINRHNALLPKNRGRLTPFWVLSNGDKETGVSIHFVTEEIDAGDIIVQKRFAVQKKDSFNSLVDKNYRYAHIAILDAINKLENGIDDFIKNDDKIASYNSTPNLKEAWEFRINRISNFIFNK